MVNIGSQEKPSVAISILCIHLSAQEEDIGKAYCLRCLTKMDGLWGITVIIFTLKAPINISSMKAIPAKCEKRSKTTIPRIWKPYILNTMATLI